MQRRYINKPEAEKIPEEKGSIKMLDRDEIQKEIEMLTFLLALLANAETEEEKAEIEMQLIELAVAMEVKEEIEGGWNK